jgi:hypothetical protein
MKSITTFSALALAVFFSFVLMSRPVESQDSRPAAADVKINKLQVERRDTLRRLLEVVTVRHRAGQGTVDNVIRAQAGLLDAELQLARTKEERIRMHEERVKNARGLENVLEHQYTAAHVSIDQWLTAKAARLQAEIDLLHEQAGND